MSALAAGARAVAQLLDLHSHRHDDLEARAASTIRALVDELEAVGVALATAERQRDLARKAVRRDRAIRLGPLIDPPTRVTAATLLPAVDPRDGLCIVCGHAPGDDGDCPCVEHRAPDLGVGGDVA